MGALRSLSSVRAGIGRDPGPRLLTGIVLGCHTAPTVTLTVRLGVPPTWTVLEAIPIKPASP